MFRYPGNLVSSATSFKPHSMLKRRLLSLGSIQAGSCFLISKCGGIFDNGQYSNAHVTTGLHSRWYSSGDSNGKNLEGILKKSTDKKVKVQYPNFSKKKGQKRNINLNDLLDELKGNPKAHSQDARIETSDSTDLQSSPIKSSIDGFSNLLLKTDPLTRVNALQKHFVEANISKCPDERGSDNSSAILVSDDESNYAPEKLVDQIHKTQRSQIIPDKTEVGGLLAALMDGKVDESNVKDVMANIRPGEGRVYQLSKLKTREKADRLPRSHITKESSTSGSDKRTQMFLKKSRLFNGPRSHYLDELFGLPKSAKDNKVPSIHERKWNLTVRDSVPKLGPSDGFEAIMLNSGKMWNFPIDNEEGLSEEENSNFEDHVFLDQHLDLFPEKGQIRKFMELVVIGLQQNPHCTVEQKVEQINWFKTYFDKFGDADLEF